MEFKSSKLKHVTEIRNKVISILNNNQDIKKLVYYNVNNPLEQEDVEMDLFNVRIHPIFSKKVLKNAEIHIFVRRLESDLSELLEGENTIVIDIISPVEYSILDENNDRESLIGTTICDLLDQSRDFPMLGKMKVAHCKESMLEQQDKEFNVMSLFVEYSSFNTKRR